MAMFRDSEGKPGKELGSQAVSEDGAVGNSAPELVDMKLMKDEGRKFNWR